MKPMSTLLRASGSERRVDGTALGATVKVLGPVQHEKGTPCREGCCVHAGCTSFATRAAANFLAWSREAKAFRTSWPTHSYSSR